jgi:hypothetical protein
MYLSEHENLKIHLSNKQFLEVAEVAAAKEKWREAKYTHH